MSRTRNLVGVVSLGGGNGLSCLLKGLKHGISPSQTGRPAAKGWISCLTAVVTVTDDGGSSGRLRSELQVLPPGDIRNCLVALSMDESLLSELFQYRFTGTGALRGHSFGNLLLTALTEVTGDFLKAIQFSSSVLAIRGQIYPSTLDDVRLEAFLDNGVRVRGESAISGTNSRIRKVALSPRGCRPVRKVLDAIRTADIITVGPGSLYTSLLPNLLVPGIAHEIRKARALKVFIGNLMTQPGETQGFTASDHLEAIYSHAGNNLFDAIILNNKPIAKTILSRYKERGSVPVVSDFKRIRDLGLTILEGDLLAQERAIRHDPNLLATALFVAHKQWTTSELLGSAKRSLPSL
jgi:uncharacterized cofD-like protein